jgi:hypothetical protein
LAKEAKMTDVNVTPYSLSFASFSIEVCIDEQLSVDFSKQFDHHGPGFVFAVAEIWLDYEGPKHLIVPATRPENFLECLRGLGICLLSPPSVPGIEEVIICGGWCSWMAGYWDRVDRESNTADDEKLYDLLIPLSFVESKVGHIAVYMYGGKKIFEVAVRPDEGGNSAGAWAQFNSEVLGNEVADLTKVVASSIRSTIKKSVPK